MSRTRPSSVSLSEKSIPPQCIQPVCPVFGQCGGCQYQDIPYEKELALKEQALRDLLNVLCISSDAWQPIVPSPKQYHYRCRLDLKMIRTRAGEFFMGFSPRGRYRVVPVEACPLALEPISDFLPRLKETAIQSWRPKYRNANLVVKTGDDGRVFWGGIGRRSLRQDPADCLWTVINGRRIHYGLDTFFQANLSILPVLFERIKDLNILAQDGTLFDLYGGVGLFGSGLYDEVGRVVLLEENKYAVGLARVNGAYNRMGRFQIIAGRVEEQDLAALRHAGQGRAVGIIDPPRKGLDGQAARLATDLRWMTHLLYLSCQPEALARDLQVFITAGWQVVQVIPFDFFPRTRHLETLVLLGPVSSESMRR